MAAGTQIADNDPGTEFSDNRFYDYMATPSTNAGTETRRQTFERVLSLEPFTGLKAILDSLARDREALCNAVVATKSYDELVARLGFRMTLVPQIHVQDAFSRLGRDGGIKSVLPYYDIPTQSSLPTLVNFDSTVTSTSESAAFFNRMLAAFKAQLGA
jgi:hypothetical protein